MTGFEVAIGDMDLLKQFFDRQKAHMDAIREYVQGNCTTPGGFGVVLQPLAPSYENAYHDGVTGLGNGATVAETCGTKIIETKTALIETDRAQYERYRKHEESLGHDTPPYQAPAGGGTLPPASKGYTEPGEPFEYPGVGTVPAWFIEQGYDAADWAARVGYTPEHAAPDTAPGSSSNGADGNGSTDSSSGSGSSDGSSSSGSSDSSGSSSSGGSSSGSSDSSSGGSSGSSSSSSGDSSSGSSSGSSGGGGDSSSSSSSSSSGSGGAHSSTNGRHESTDTGNLAGKATDLYNAPGEYIEVGQDYAETAGTREDIDDATQGPENDDQTEWANSGSSW